MSGDIFILYDSSGVIVEHRCSSQSESRFKATTVVLNPTPAINYPSMRYHAESGLSVCSSVVAANTQSGCIGNAVA